MDERVATVLTVYGIETADFSHHRFYINNVATVLTVYGIETKFNLLISSKTSCLGCNSAYRLRY